MLHGGGRKHYKNIISLNSEPYSVSEKGLNYESMNTLLNFLKKIYFFREQSDPLVIRYLDDNDTHLPDDSIKNEIINNLWTIQVKITKMPIPGNLPIYGLVSFHKYISVVLISPTNNEFLLFTIGAEGEWDSDINPRNIEYVVSIPDKMSSKCMKSRKSHDIHYDCKKKLFAQTGSTKIKKKIVNHDGKLMIGKIMFFLLTIIQSYESEQNQLTEFLLKKMELKKEHNQVKYDCKLKSDKLMIQKSLLRAANKKKKEEKVTIQDNIKKLTSEYNQLKKDSNEILSKFREASENFEIASKIKQMEFKEDEYRISSLLWNTNYIYDTGILKEFLYKISINRRMTSCHSQCTNNTYNCWHFGGIMYSIFTSNKYCIDFSSNEQFIDSLQSWETVRTSRKVYCCIRQLIISRGIKFSQEICDFMN